MKTNIAIMIWCPILTRTNPASSLPQRRFESELDTAKTTGKKISFRHSCKVG